MSKGLTPYEVEQLCAEVLHKIEPVENDYLHTGKSNAKEADVRITHKRTNRQSYAECKKGNALAGEIQVKPDPATKTFSYVEKLLPNGNRPSISPYAEKAVKFLNDNHLYDTLMKAGKKRVNVELSPKLCKKCVDCIYKDKGVEIFFIYKNGKHVLFMRNRLGHYLEISVRFRFHPSGSKRHFKTRAFEDYLQAHEYTYKIIETNDDYSPHTKTKEQCKKSLIYVETNADMPDLFTYKHDSSEYPFKFEKCKDNLWIVTKIPPEDKTYPCLEFRCKIKTMDQNENDLNDVKYFLQNGKRRVRKYKIKHIYKR